MCVFLVVELLAAFGKVAKRLSWGELLFGVGARIALHVADELIGAIQIDKAERTAPEGRKSETKNTRNVAIRLKRREFD